MNGPVADPEVISALLIGFGAVHRHLCAILHEKPEVRFGGKTLRIVGVCDSSGGVYSSGGLEPGDLKVHKEGGFAMRDFQPRSHDGEAIHFEDAETMARLAPAYDVLLEAACAKSGAGLAAAKAALTRSEPAHIVFANKAPLVLCYNELHVMAKRVNRLIRNSATVCGGLPVLNVATRDLHGACIRSVRGIFNSTTSYILDRMLAGEPQHQALGEAQRRGIAEADPSLDIDGYDTANKLILIANALGLRARPDDVVRLSDVVVRGIREVSAQTMLDAKDKGQRMQLIASAMPTADKASGLYAFRVEPESIPSDTFLGSFKGSDMGVVFETDIYETVYMKTDEEGVFPTAAAMLRDINSIYTRHGGSD